MPLRAEPASPTSSCIPAPVTNFGDYLISIYLSIIQMPDASEQLRFRRFLFLPRLLRAAPDSLLRVFDASYHQDGYFACTIKDDLVWLGKRVMRLADTESPPAILYQWLNLSSTASWRSILRNAYYNGNRLYLDSVSHTCMLSDIRKLHAIAGIT